MPRNPDAEKALPREVAEVRFADLYRDHEREILRYALRRCSDQQDAADIVAETFLVAWRRLGDVPLDEASRLWLYATARRVLANHRRGLKRRTELGNRLREELRRQLALLPPAEHSGVLEALGEMTEGDRELLMLIGLEELTPSQAARVLGISTTSARTRLYRARRRLRVRLVEQTASKLGKEIEMEKTR